MVYYSYRMRETYYNVRWIMFEFFSAQVCRVARGDTCTYIILCTLVLSDAHYLLLFSMTS